MACLSFPGTFHFLSSVFGDSRKLLSTYLWGQQNHRLSSSSGNFRCNGLRAPQEGNERCIAFHTCWVQVSHGCWEQSQAHAQSLRSLPFASATQAVPHSSNITSDPACHIAPAPKDPDSSHTVKFQHYLRAGPPYVRLLGTNTILLTCFLRQRAWVSRAGNQTLSGKACGCCLRAQSWKWAPQRRPHLPWDSEAFPWVRVLSWCKPCSPPLQACTHRWSLSLGGEGGRQEGVKACRRPRITCWFLSSWLTWAELPKGSQAWESLENCDCFSACRPRFPVLLW